MPAPDVHRRARLRAGNEGQRAQPVPLRLVTEVAVRQLAREPRQHRLEGRVEEEKAEVV